MTECERSTCTSTDCLVVETPVGASSSSCAVQKQSLGTFACAGTPVPRGSRIKCYTVVRRVCRCTVRIKRRVAPRMARCRSHDGYMRAARGD